MENFIKPRPLGASVARLLVAHRMTRFITCVDGCQRSLSASVNCPGYHRPRSCERNLKCTYRVSKLNRRIVIIVCIDKGQQRSCLTRFNELLYRVIASSGKLTIGVGRLREGRIDLAERLVVIGDDNAMCVLSFRFLIEFIDERRCGLSSTSPVDGLSLAETPTADRVSGGTGSIPSSNPH